MVVSRNGLEVVNAVPVEQVTDVTGAGDLFAAGFLVGYSRGKDHRTAARLGALAAAEVIQHVGARPAVSLRALAAENGMDV
jgi:adenosine kinase